PMLDLSLFRRPAFIGVSLGTVAIGAGMFAMFLYISLYLQDVLGYSPLGAGLRFLPLSALVFFVPLATQRLSIRVPARVLMGTGLVIISVGLLLMHGLTPSSSWTSLLAGFLVAGVGIGLVNPAFGAGLNSILLMGSAILLCGAIASLALIRARDFQQAPQPTPQPAPAPADS